MIHVKMPLFLLACLPAFYASVTGKPRNDLSVSVNEKTGVYTVSSNRLHWKFEGTVGQPVRDVSYSQGSDALGHFRSVSFKWTKEIPYTGSIRCYDDQPVAVFTLSLPEGSRKAPAAFPDFTSFPRIPHHFSYQDKDFAPPLFTLEQTSTPWLLFDDDLRSCLISPASDFIVSQMTGDGVSRISSGLNAEIKGLAAGFSHTTLLVMDQGVRHAWDTWGAALRTLYDRKLPASDADPILKYYGYWTDNGADYYYNYDTSKGYDGTLLALREHYRSRHIPLGYMQLDSWWYEKSINGPRGGVEDHKNKALPMGPWNRYGGLMEYRADPYLFPDGLEAFGKKIALPFITHNRWIDQESPYRRMYATRGVTPVDPAYWKDIIDYIKSFGAIAYEQDWLNIIYQRTPEMASDLSVGNDFTDGMAKATRADGLHMQYCMAMPRFFLQGVKYNNLTTIRTSPDRFEPRKWMHFLFTAQLGYEVGIWPWSDVFMSGETGNMILSVLSAGPVGTGDAIGREDRDNILKACRTDGVLVKPDAPLLPTDGSYLQLARGESKPLLAFTYTRHESLTTDYLFAFAGPDTRDTAFSIRPAAIGMAGKTVVYSPVTGLLKVLKAALPFEDHLNRGGYNYYILAPITACGIALLGDEGKIAATGKKRISSVTVTPDQMTVTVVFAPGESGITLRGYAESAVTADTGVLRQDAAGALFSVKLEAPAAGHTVSLTIRRKSS